MTRRRGPTKRLLILPALLVIGLLLLVHAVRDATHRPVDPTIGVVDLPPVAGGEASCAREDPRADIDDIRAELDLRGRVTSGLVHACPEAFDGLEVTYVGEAVGDLLRRDGGAWVMVNDDDYALETGPLPTHRDRRGTNSSLTVWLPDRLHRELTGLGEPNQRGDVVQLRGVILRTDPDDGGGLTLRARDLTVLAPATAVTEPLDRPQAVLALATAGAGVLLWTVRRRSGGR